MSVLRIYADFNGLVRGVKDPARTAIVLDTFGSLKDLSNAGQVLHEGLPLVAVDWSDEHEDLEGHGTAQYDTTHNRWVVEFDEQGVRYVPAGDRAATTEFLCVHCRRPISIPAVGSAFALGAECSFCGTSVLAAYAPPSLAT